MQCRLIRSWAWIHRGRSGRPRRKNILVLAIFVMVCSPAHYHRTSILQFSDHCTAGVREISSRKNQGVDRMGTLQSQVLIIR